MIFRRRVHIYDHYGIRSRKSIPRMVLGTWFHTSCILDPMGSFAEISACFVLLFSLGVRQPLRSRPGFEYSAGPQNP